MLFPSIIIVVLISLVIVSSSNLSSNSIIPKLSNVIDLDGNFQINQNTKLISISSPDCSFESEVSFLQNLIKITTGFDLEVSSSIVSSFGIPNAIYLTSDCALSPKENYSLSIVSDSIKISSSSRQGLFSAIQTIAQLVRFSSGAEWRIPSGEIYDEPLFPYRGFMIDVARHFFSVDDVKFMIDLISSYKMNYLHIHLSDDQGWRIQIDSYPLLSQIGGLSQVGGGKGGYFTKDQFREIVSYAQDRHVTIVPEVDMPSHINAALSSYGFLNPDCRKEMPSNPVVVVDRSSLSPPAPEDPLACDLYVGIDVGFSLLDFKEDKVYSFLDSVLSEIAELSPGPYLHIGGDEPNSITKEEYNSFMIRAIEIAKSKGKIVSGWQEISRVSSPDIKEVVSQVWYQDGTLRPQGPVLLSPADHAYLDMSYNSNETLGLHWSGYVELKDSYEWDPMSYLPKHVLPSPESSILGVEAALWTETILTRSDIEYMILPRLPAIAELAWGLPDQKKNSHPPSKKDYQEFLNRINVHASGWWTQEGWNYHHSPGM